MGISKNPLNPQSEIVIERIGTVIKDELIEQGLTDRNCNFLEPHGLSISERIKDEDLIKLHIIYINSQKIIFE